MPQDRYPRRRRRVEEWESPHIDLETRERLDRRDDVKSSVFHRQLRDPKVELVKIGQPVALVVGPALVDELLAEPARACRTSQVIQMDYRGLAVRVAPAVVQEA